MKFGISFKLFEIMQPNMWTNLSEQHFSSRQFYGDQIKNT